MQSTTNVERFVEEGPKSSQASVLPRVIRPTSEFCFLDRQGILTAVEAKAPSETAVKERIATPVRRLTRTQTVGGERFTLLQKWEGVVLEADAESFTARLFDGLGELPPQQATFSRDEISPEEQTQIAAGAPFVWTIGYRHVGTTRHRDSTFYFRRLPPWDKGEIKVAEARARNNSDAIGWK